ncbi:MAG: hypothetical protein V1494_08235 [Candidatus Diapherotrites archaeon]
MNPIITLNGLLRAYLYNKWKSPKIELIIYNAKFAQVTEKLNETFCAIIEFGNDPILIKKAPFGNRFYSQVKNQTSVLSIAKLISLEEKNIIRELVKENGGYYTKNVEVQINPSEWNMQFHDFFTESPEEQQLVKELAENFKMQNITANSKKAKKYGNGDILLTYQQKEVPIEITIHPPSYRQKEIKKGINAPHGQKWGKVTSRILPMFIFSVNNKSPSFIIIHNDWKKYSHTQKLKEQIKKSKCFLIYTNFQKDWEKCVRAEIERFLGDELCYV